jgi:hypothetical protein
MVDVKSSGLRSDETFTVAWASGGLRGPAGAYGKAPDDSLLSTSLPVPGQLQITSQARLANGLKHVAAASAGIRRLCSAALDPAYDRREVARRRQAFEVVPNRNQMCCMTVL